MRVVGYFKITTRIFKKSVALRVNFLSDLLILSLLSYSSSISSSLILIHLSHLFYSLFISYSFILAFSLHLIHIHQFIPYSSFPLIQAFPPANSFISFSLLCIHSSDTPTHSLIHLPYLYFKTHSFQCSIHAPFISFCLLILL